MYVAVSSGKCNPADAPHQPAWRPPVFVLTKPSACCYSSVDGAEKPVSLHIERVLCVPQVRGKGMFARKVCILGFVLVTLASAIQGCRDEDLARPDINRPPETILSVAPEMGDEAFHKYRVRWTGLDEDGVVTEYKVATVAEDEIYGGRSSEEDIAEYLIDLPWYYTDATESLFVLRADRPNSRRHSLYVVAIDNEGKEDPSPALTNFTAVDYELPIITIRIADNINPIPRIPGSKGDTLPAYNLLDPGAPIDIRLSWEGYDPDGEIVEWRYKLDSAVEVPLPPDSTGMSLTYLDGDPQASDVMLGFHEFRLSAVDDANARSDRATARFVINYDPNTVIDSVWSYREKTNNTSVNPAPGPALPQILIFAREWRENPDSAAKYAEMRMGYHFGPIRMKFHGSDKDGPLSGAPPDSFKWSIQGINLSGDVGSGAVCGEDGEVVFYCAQSNLSPRLDSDRPYTLIFNAVDDRDKQDGSPDTVKFNVNFPPEILGITHQVLDSVTGRTRISWDAVDIDQGYGWGSNDVQALMLYRFRYRLKGTPQYSQWTYVDTPLGRDKIVNKYGEIASLEPGTYDLELQAYDGTYVETRVDKMNYEFSVP